MTWARIPAQWKASFFSIERFQNSLNLKIVYNRYFLQVVIFRVCCNICLNKIWRFIHSPLKFIPLIFLYIINIFGYGKQHFFSFWDIFILFVTFFQSCYLIFHTQKVSTHFKEQNKKKESWQLVKNKKVIQIQKMS